MLDIVEQRKQDLTNSCDLDFFGENMARDLGYLANLTNQLTSVLYEVRMMTPGYQQRSTRCAEYALFHFTYEPFSVNKLKNNEFVNTSHVISDGDSIAKDSHVSESIQLGVRGVNTITTPTPCTIDARESIQCAASDAVKHVSESIQPGVSGVNTITTQTACTTYPCKSTRYAASDAVRHVYESSQPELSGVNTDTVTTQTICTRICGCINSCAKP